MDKDTLYKIEHQLIMEGMIGVEDHHKREFYHYVEGITTTIETLVETMDDVKPEKQEVRSMVSAPDPKPSVGKGRPPKVDIEELERMWNQGVRTKELAEHFGVSNKTINKYVTMLRAEEDRIIE